MTVIDCALPLAAQLGESPVWSQREQALYWIDMGHDDPCEGVSINCFNPASGRNQSWPLSERIGAFALSEGGGALLALRSGMHHFDFKTGQTRLLAPSAFTSPLLRYNDGRCDRQGRFWVGQAQPVAPDIPRGQGALCRYDGHTLSTHGGGITCSNGMAFSPDGRTMYYADVLQWRVFACDYDPERGTMGPTRTFIEFPKGVVPDGAAVDAEGGYWIALYNAGKLARYLPDGSLDREIALPVSCPTMVAFGGADLGTLYITTAQHRLTPEQRAQQPQAGMLLSCRPGVQGLPEPLFRPGA